MLRTQEILRITLHRQWLDCYERTKYENNTRMLMLKNKFDYLEKYELCSVKL